MFLRWVTTASSGPTVDAWPTAELRRRSSRGWMNERWPAKVPGGLEKEPRVSTVFEPWFLHLSAGP